jgi:hypothetical protein
VKYTLLELTQRILESMDSDEVDSIEDSPESLAVANIIKECYFDILGKLDLPEAETIFQLTASGDSALPALMYLPDDVLDLNRVYYNDSTTSDPRWYQLTFMPFDHYLDFTNGLSIEDDTVTSMDVVENGQTFVFKFRNDRMPLYYTSFNDRTLLFDGADLSINPTLMGAKTLAYGAMEPSFTLSDVYVPDLDARQFQLLLQAAKAQAFVELKQIENPKAERKERKNEILAQRTKRAIDKRPERYKYLGYGR